MSKTETTTDVLIIGGGLAGLTLAAVLGRKGVNVTCIDRAPPVTQLTENYDARCTALSWATHHVLKEAGAWDQIRAHAEPMYDIRVADGDAPLFLHFAANTEGKEETFGWNLENILLRKFLFENIERLKDNVRHIAPVEITSLFHNKNSAGVVLKDGRRLSAPLMIGADGRNSTVRRWLNIETKNTDYKQTAIVCNISHEKDHENVAVEHFLPAGPFALIPLTKDKKKRYRSSVIWTVHSNDAQKILKLSPENFDQKLQQLCGDHLGKVHHISQPASFPLKLMLAKKYTAPRVALMAEAAHAVHPIAGQGLNLSMRDVALLSTLITTQLRLGLDIGAETLLNKYEKERKNDTRIMVGFTDALNLLFSNNLKSISLARTLGLGIIQKTPILKGFFARQAMGTHTHNKENKTKKTA